MTERRACQCGRVHSSWESLVPISDKAAIEADLKTLRGICRDRRINLAPVDLVPKKVAAEFLARSPRTLEAWIDDDKLHPEIICGRSLFSLVQIATLRILQK